MEPVFRVFESMQVPGTPSYASLLEVGSLELGRQLALLGLAWLGLQSVFACSDTREGTSTRQGNLYYTREPLLYKGTSTTQGNLY